MRYTYHPLRITHIPFTKRIIPFSHESNRIPIHHIITLTHQSIPYHIHSDTTLYATHGSIRMIKSKNRVNMLFSQHFPSTQFLIFLPFTKRNPANRSGKQKESQYFPRTFHTFPR